MKPNHSRRLSPRTTLVIILLICLCITVSLISTLSFQLVNQAKSTFGLPADKLNNLQRIILPARLILDQKYLLVPVDPAGNSREFHIDLGESVQSITQRLKLDGIISSADALEYYFTYTGLDTGIQAGDYQLSPAMTAMEIANKIQNASAKEVDLVVFAGWRMEEIAKSLSLSGIQIDENDFINAVSQGGQGQDIKDLIPDIPENIEGYLYPDTYHISRTVTVQDLLFIMVDNFKGHLSTTTQAGFERQGLSEYQAIIVASIIQREAMVPDEMPVIASVYLNRLKIGMKLDSDPTVQYAIGYNSIQSTWWTNPLSVDDLRINSPYNTYLSPGLPPGPISNPGKDALDAVAEPAQTDYLYFRARCDNSGRHVFAKTYDEQINNACH